MAKSFVMKQGMVSVSSTSTIEAMETDIETGIIVLARSESDQMWSSTRDQGGWHTIESKH